MLCSKVHPFLAKSRSHWRPSLYSMDIMWRLSRWMWSEDCVPNVRIVRTATTYNCRNTILSARVLESRQMVHDYRNQNRRFPGSDKIRLETLAWFLSSYWSKTKLGISNIMSLLMPVSRVMGHDSKHRIDDARRLTLTYQIGGNFYLRFDHLQLNH